MSGRRKRLKLVGGGGRSEFVLGVGVIKKCGSPRGPPSPRGYCPKCQNRVFGGLLAPIVKVVEKKGYSAVEEPSSYTPIYFFWPIRTREGVMTKKLAKMAKFHGRPGPSRAGKL